MGQFQKNSRRIYEWIKIKKKKNIEDAALEDIVGIWCFSQRYLHMQE